jgi:hypothetical protein
VQKRILSIAITAFLFSLIIVGCSKLDTTDIGGDLLPAVDNVNTFETTLPINTTQGIFTVDTTRVGSGEDQVFGKISNDPLFGTTTANLYAQFKPTFFPFYYNNPKDSIIAFDSVVLCLSYKGNWGDSTQPIDLQVKEIPYSVGNNGFWDSMGISNKIDYAPATANVVGSAQVNVTNLGKYVVYANHKDSVKNQIRIKLSGTFVNNLFVSDTTGVKNYFKSDSLFRAFHNGLAIVANGAGNCLLYTNLTDSSTKLEVHFRRKNAGIIDTTYASFKVITTALYSANNKLSSTADNIVRNRTGYPVSTPSATELYLQTSPGTYANLNIPALDTLSNRIIHRAEIIIEQIPPITQLDKDFSPPNFLYIDLKDTGTTNKWKPVYFDLNPNVGYTPDNNTVYSFFQGSGIDFAYYGGFPRDKTDPFGNAIKYYNFNITRHVQQIVTKHTVNYPLRLYAPYNLDYAQYYPYNLIPFNNRLANGRVKVGSGSNTNYRMRLRIVYSKI